MRRALNPGRVAKAKFLADYRGKEPEVTETPNVSSVVNTEVAEPTPKSVPVVKRTFPSLKERKGKAALKDEQPAPLPKAEFLASLTGLTPEERKRLKRERWEAAEAAKRAAVKEKKDRIARGRAAVDKRAEMEHRKAYTLKCPGCGVVGYNPHFTNEFTRCIDCQRAGRG